MVYVSSEDANYLELPPPGGSGSDPGSSLAPKEGLFAFQLGDHWPVVSVRGPCGRPVQGPCMTVGGEAEAQGGGSTARILAPGLCLPRAQAKALAATGQAKGPAAPSLD